MTQGRRLSLPLDEVSLFLDLDGTLAPFQPTPDAVGPEPERNDRLRRLADRLNGRMAVVSGRSIADLDRILDGAVATLAGIHGLQMRSGTGLRAAAVHPRLNNAVAELEAFAGRFPEVRIETKPLSVAIHYRGNPGVEPVAKVFADDLAQRTGLKLQHGAMVAEFLTPGGDKGAAIGAFMDELPFAGSTPLFVGDDLTDEDGFRAVRRWGGWGVLVGPSRSTFARYRLASEAAVHAWLEAGLQTGRLELEVCVEPSYCRI